MAKKGKRWKQLSATCPADGFPVGVLSGVTDIHYYCSSIQGHENMYRERFQKYRRSSNKPRRSSTVENLLDAFFRREAVSRLYEMRLDPYKQANVILIPTAHCIVIISFSNCFMPRQSNNVIHVTLNFPSGGQSQIKTAGIWCDLTELLFIKTLIWHHPVSWQW